MISQLRNQQLNSSNTSAPTTGATNSPVVQAVAAQDGIEANKARIYAAKLGTAPKKGTLPKQAVAARDSIINDDNSEREHIPGSYVVAIEFEGPLRARELMDEAFKSLVPALEKQMLGARTTSDGRKVAMVQLRLPEALTAGKVASLMQQNAGLGPTSSGFVKTLGIHPNYLYKRPYEKPVPAAVEPGTPSRHIVEQGKDPRQSEQGHLAIIQAPEAWAFMEEKLKELGKTMPEIVVATNDDGFDLEHGDLKDRAWKNTKEIPGNGVDDDGNGYIDDVKGWDTSDNDNDPTTPSTGDSHGTHVWGIQGQTHGNDQGGKGVAPNFVKLMPIRWAGGQRPWTTAVIVESMLYGVNNGASAINVSYNTDGWVGDQAIADSLKFAQQKDVMLVFSAGNNGQKDPPRAKLEGPVFVSSLEWQGEEKDVKASYSNYGKTFKKHLSAHGSNIDSSLPFNEYGSMSGTSMAAPMVNGAAFIRAFALALGFRLSADQTYQILRDTGDNVDAQNPRYKGQLSNRINLLNAVKRVWEMKP